MANNHNLITNLCTTKFAILKWLQILCCILSVLFLIDGRLQWWPYTMIFVCAIILGILCLATLLIHYFVRQSKIPLSTVEIAFNVAAIAISFGFAVLLIVDFVKMQGGEFNHHRFLPPANIKKDGWKNRILVVAIAQALNTVFHALSLFEARRV